MRLASTRTLRREIDEAVLAGRSIGDIETEVIAPCALDDDARAALWLYADACVGRAGDVHLGPIADTSLTQPSASV